MYIIFVYIAIEESCTNKNRSIFKVTKRIEISSGTIALRSYWREILSIDLLPVRRFVNHLGSPCHIGVRLIRPVDSLKLISTVSQYLSQTRHVAAHGVILLTIVLRETNF